MTTLFGAIKMLFGNKGLYYRAYVGGVVKIFDCPRATLPYIDNHMVDFNIADTADSSSDAGGKLALKVAGIGGIEGGGGQR